MMKNPMARQLPGVLLVLGVLAALAAAQTPQAPASAASAFELKMRVLEGTRDKTPAQPKPVTSSYLKFLTFANSDSEEDVQTERQMRKVYNLKDVSLLTEATLMWMRSEKADKAFHMFRLNGQEYAVFVTPGKVPERNQFRIEVYEQGADKKSNLLDTEFSLPDKTAAVFGFETAELKMYFITLRVARWIGEPAGAVAKGAGGTVGGVVGGVLKAGGPDKVKPPKLIKDVQPVYPEAARKAGVQGVVIMEATTDTYGRVASVKVLRSIPLLDQAALDALRQWVYEPMVIDGKPHPVVFTVTMRFNLDDKKKPQVEGGVAEGVQGGVEGGVTGGVVGGVEGGVQGGVEGGVEGGVVGGVLGAKDLKQFEGDAVRAVGEVKPPKLVKEVRPVYPKEAAKAGVEGVVILEAKADEKGDVIETRVLRSIPPLDQAAIDAIKQWKYEPMVIDGKPRKVIFTVTVRFNLDESKAGRTRAVDKFAAGAIKAEGDVKPPLLIKEVVPVYPETARVAGVEGVVILSVKTDEAGKVADTMVLRSIPLLDQAAIDAVKQWVYEPFVKDGKAQPVVFTVTVRFQLKENFIRPGDSLDIDVRGLPSLKGSYLVSPKGNIDFPLLGEITADFMNVSDFQSLLTQLLDSKYTKNAEVVVNLKRAGK
jgi:TonB family protein